MYLSHLIQATIMMLFVFSVASASEYDIFVLNDSDNYGCELHEQQILDNAIDAEKEKIPALIVAKKSSQSNHGYLTILVAKNDPQTNVILFNGGDHEQCVLEAKEMSEYKKKTQGKGVSAKFDNIKAEEIAKVNAKANLEAKKREAATTSFEFEGQSWEPLNVYERDTVYKEKGYPTSKGYGIVEFIRVKHNADSYSHLITSYLYFTDCKSQTFRPIFERYYDRNQNLIFQQEINMSGPNGRIWVMGDSFINAAKKACS